MNKIRLTISALFVVLVVANVYIFVSGIRIGDEINYLERETKVLHEQNVGLNAKISLFNSLKYAGSVAEKMNFKKKSSPIYLENLGFAKN